jgi:Ubiquitin 3 binding protein But2 C-terminal domain
MKLSAILLPICGLAVSAAVIQRDKAGPCCFSLIAEGTVNGPVGEDTKGENGVGTDFPQSVYCIYNGTVTDSGGQPCTILFSNGKFVCEANSTLATSHFTLADNGDLLHDGNPYYFACPSAGVSSDGSYNIFSDSIADASSCTSITLLTGAFSCAALGRPSSISTAATTTSTQLQFATSASCPTDISSGTYLAPNLIIPISPSSPSTSYGTQYTATITPSNGTIFAFDIPPTYTGACALLFLFPFSSDAQFPYVFSGIEEESASPGAGLDFALLKGEISEVTSWDSQLAVGEEYGVMEVFPGENYTVAVGPCASGQRVGYLVGSVGGVVLEFFQSTGGSPVGVWIVRCE